MRKSQRSSMLPDRLPIPIIFRIWITLCALAGLISTGVAVWAIIKLVNHFTQH